PLLPAGKGSDHGYDVVGFDRVDNQRGGLDGWTRLLAAARSRGLGLVVDIVPNHSGVAEADQNPAWWDVLRHGRDSAYACWFDVEWGTGPILVPVLGDDFTPAQLEMIDGELRYFEHRFPVAAGTVRPGDDASEVHHRQHYRLVNYREADTSQNYRRFFAVSVLAGLRVEDEAVFDATHAQIGTWLREDAISGLRIDHPDGLADPLGYLTRLRSLAGPDSWITVEKILEPGEQLAPEWPVAGTTGYDALAEVGALFVDPSSRAQLDATYRQLTGDNDDFHEHVRRGKRLAVTTILRAEVARLHRLVPGIDHSAEALKELLIAFPVYRSYAPTGTDHLRTALSVASSVRPDLADTFAALAPRLADPSDELCIRFQQTSGAVMAKGVEDTAYYRYTRFIALNEVGANPAEFGASLEEFHGRQHRRQHCAAKSMTTLSTHDTKRGEDVRARLAVLSEFPAEWHQLATHLLDAAPIPDAPFGYLLWQTFAGAGFIDRGRMHAYVEKAMREAAVATTWLDPNPRFESTVHAAVDAAYDAPAIRKPLADFIARITPYGWSNSLAQKLVQLTMPGIPDVYQGTELWDDSLVDPDNRRPVDLDSAQVMLDTMDGEVEAPPIDATGAAKLWLTSRTLRLRRDWPDLFGSYSPLPATGASADHVIAFDRGGAVTIATRLPVTLERAGGWRDTSLDLGRGGTDIVSGRRLRGWVALSEVLSHYPVALLVH
ncbi:MAG: malto-oligosyltrehalose synthase, partial [Actinomycetota bacterium]|nr:malto-oligosyltrehalose synthase [Actinomycetota bacterium]